MLNVRDIHVFYGDSHVVFGASLDVQNLETVCLLGRNGAGKSTTLKSIIGLVPIKQGSVSFNGRDITHEPVFKRGKMGIGYVPEDRGLFPRLTLSENLRVSAIGVNAPGIDRAFEVFPHLKRYLNTPAQSLSGGEQQMLTVGRGIVGERRLLLLDECTQGLAPKICENLMEALRTIRKSMAILLVEQNVNFALELADRAYIMRDGHIVFSGKPDEVREDPSLQDYLAIGR